MNRALTVEEEGVDYPRLALQDARVGENATLKGWRYMQILGPGAAFGEALPGVAQMLAALQIVFLLDSAFDAEFGKDGHHVAEGDSRKFGGAAKGGLSVLIFFDREEDSAARGHVPDSFGQIATVALGEFMEELGSMRTLMVLLMVLSPTCVLHPG